MPTRAHACVGLVPALLALTTACKGADGQAAPVPSASGAAPSAILRVKESDCAKWADHAADVTVSAFEDAARSCPEDLRLDVLRRFGAQRVAIRATANDLCTQHIDEKYADKDARCFMNATAAGDLTACKLAPMANPDDADRALLVEELRRSCAMPQLRQAPPSRSGP
jgi:hypothetical protein